MAPSRQQNNKENDGARSRKNFESKPKVKAKVKKVSNHVMEHFFPVTKPKGEVSEKNFQGFPMKTCKFREEVNNHVHCPPGYGASAFAIHQDWDFCTTCLLCPCIVIEKEEDIMDFCRDVASADETSTSEMLWKAIGRSDELIEEIFGVRYARKTAPPKCLTELLEIYFDELRKQNGETWDESPEDEFAAESEEGQSGDFGFLGGMESFFDPTCLQTQQF